MSLKVMKKMSKIAETGQGRVEGHWITGDKVPCTEPVYAEYMVILCLKY
jgi:hypothetical protein